MAHANALATALALMDGPIGAESMSDWICALADADNSIDVGALRHSLNEDRVPAGFPEIADVSEIEMLMEERRRWYVTVLKKALDQMPSNELVRAVTLASGRATKKGQVLGPLMIYKLVDAYEIEAQEFLALEVANVGILANRVLRAAQRQQDIRSIDARAIDVEIGYVERVMRNWDYVAQPVQLCRMSRGQRHENSEQMANIVTVLLVTLAMEHGRPRQAKRLNDLLREIFAEVPVILEQTNVSDYNLTIIQRRESNSARL